MSDKMYLNLNELDLNKYIYRIISYDRFLEIFRDRQNTLVKPELWEDTFENFVLKSQLQTDTGEVIKYNVHERMYGQCWTLENTSDAMWRIYSPDKNSVRLRTTIGDLLNSLLIGTADRVNCLQSIGKVEYLSEKKLIKRAKFTFGKQGEVTFGNLFKSLLLKRKAFYHENEVRLMFLDWNVISGSEKVFKYSFDPHKLITQIMIDPRITYQEFKGIKEKILHDTGYKGKIKRSLLYRLPDTLTFEINSPKT